MVGGSISSYYYIVLFTFAGYTSFKYERDLASKLYTTTSGSSSNDTEKQDREGMTNSGELSADRQDITASILNRRQLPRYSYCGHIFDRMILLCCCCRGSRRYMLSE